VKDLVMVAKMALALAMQLELALALAFVLARTKRQCGWSEVPEDYERLLQESRKCATAMEALAEVEGNALRISESKQRLQRDIGPLSKEVRRQLDIMSRNELFPSSQPQQPMEMEQNVEMDHLLQNSDDLLKESIALCSDSEYIGNNTLFQMGQQREQLQSASENVNSTLELTNRAGIILRDMARRAFKNRLILQIMVVLMAILDLSLFIHLFRRK